MFSCPDILGQWLRRKAGSALGEKKATLFLAVCRIASQLHLHSISSHIATVLHGGTGKAEDFGTWSRANIWLVVKLALEPRSSHPSLVSGRCLKGHEHTDTQLGRSVYPRVWSGSPEATLR